MRSCDKMTELISAALDGELTEGERQELDAHLASCPVCGALWDELSGLRDAAAEPEEAPDGFAGQVMARIAADPAQDPPESVIPFPAKKRSRIPWRGWAASAAVVAVVLLGVFALPGRQSSSDSASVRSSGEPALTETEAYAADDSESEIPESDLEDTALDKIAGLDTKDIEYCQITPMPSVAATEGAAPTPAPDAFLPEERTNDQFDAAGFAVYCGVLVMTGEPLPEGLEEFESEIEENGAVAYVVPASYFFSNSSMLMNSMASNYIDYSLESNADPTAEYGLIIVEPAP